jgi:hypothetical protein
MSKGSLVARGFVHAHLLSLKVNIAAHLEVKAPKYTLLKITEKLNKKRPVAR